MTRHDDQPGVLSRRVTRDEAFTCCVNGRLVAEVVHQGGAIHRMNVDPSRARDLDEPGSQVVIHLLPDTANVPPAAMLLDHMERDLPPDEKQAVAAERGRGLKVRTMGLRLVDHNTGAPLAQVDLMLRSTGGTMLQGRTDTRGRATFQGVGRGPLQLLLNDSHLWSQTKNTTPKVAPKRFNKVEDATPEQIELIKEAHGRAEAMMARAITRLKAAKEKPDALVEKYFGISGTDKEDQRRLDRLVSGYTKMLKGMKSVGYEVEKEPIKPGEPYTVAYVHRFTTLTGIGDVHICFPPFGIGTVDDRAATIVHEVGHSRIGAKDHAYKWQEKKWNAMTRKQRLTNADSLAEFAREASR